MTKSVTRIQLYCKTIDSNLPCDTHSFANFGKRPLMYVIGFVRCNRVGRAPNVTDLRDVLPRLQSDRLLVRA